MEKMLDNWQYCSAGLSFECISPVDFCHGSKGSMSRHGSYMAADTLILKDPCSFSPLMTNVRYWNCIIEMPAEEGWEILVDYEVESLCKSVLSALCKPTANVLEVFRNTRQTHMLPQSVTSASE